MVRADPPGVPELGDERRALSAAERRSLRALTKRASEFVALATDPSRASAVCALGDAAMPPGRGGAGQLRGGVLWWHAAVTPDTWRKELNSAKRTLDGSPFASFGVGSDEAAFNAPLGTEADLFFLIKQAHWAVLDPKVSAENHEALLCLAALARVRALPPLLFGRVAPEACVFAQPASAAPKAYRRGTSRSWGIVRLIERIAALRMVVLFGDLLEDGQLLWMPGSSGADDDADDDDEPGHWYLPPLDKGQLVPRLYAGMAGAHDTVLARFCMLFDCCVKLFEGAVAQWPNDDVLVQQCLGYAVLLSAGQQELVEFATNASAASKECPAGRDGAQIECGPSWRSAASPIPTSALAWRRPCSSGTGRPRSPRPSRKAKGPRPRPRPRRAAAAPPPSQPARAPPATPPVPGGGPPPPLAPPPLPGGAPPPAPPPLPAVRRRRSRRRRPFPAVRRRRRRCPAVRRRRRRCPAADRRRRRRCPAADRRRRRCPRRPTGCGRASWNARRSRGTNWRSSCRRS